MAGKPSEKQKHLYEIVKSAQQKAFQVIEPHAEAKAVNPAARKVIEYAGYGEYFVSLGHGVDLEAHEPPTPSPQSREGLRFGNVVTIELGIYITSLGVISIEDTVLV